MNRNLINRTLIITITLVALATLSGCGEWCSPGECSYDRPPTDEEPQPTPLPSPPPADDSMAGPGNWGALEWTELELDDLVGVGNYRAYVFTVAPFQSVSYVCINPLTNIATPIMASIQYDELGYEGCPFISNRQWINCTDEYVAGPSPGSCDPDNYASALAIDALASMVFDSVPGAESFYITCEMDTGEEYEVWSRSSEDVACLEGNE